LNFSDSFATTMAQIARGGESRSRLSDKPRRQTDIGDTTTIQETLPEAAEQLEAVAAVTEAIVAVRAPADPDQRRTDAPLGRRGASTHSAHAPDDRAEALRIGRDPRLGGSTRPAVAVKPGPTS
jgi:hypothetical protein